MPSFPKNSSFLSFQNYSSPQDRDFPEGSYKTMESPSIIRWKSGKKVDPRLLMMLEYFRELYEERQEFFKEVFPEHHDEFLDIFEKVGAVALANQDNVDVQTMQRSLSIGSSLNGGSPRTPKQIDRFKVRRPALSVLGAASQGGAGDQGGQGGASGLGGIVADSSE